MLVLVKPVTGLALMKPFPKELSTFAGGADHGPGVGDGPGAGVADEEEHDVIAVPCPTPNGPAAVGHAEGAAC